MIRGMWDGWEVITVLLTYNGARWKAVFVFDDFRSERTKQNFQRCMFSRTSERKKLKNNTESTQRGGESDGLSLLSDPFGGSWSTSWTNQSAALRSSARGSLPLNGLTEVELKNGYGNTDLIRVAGGVSENREKKGLGDKLGGLLVLCPFSVFKI